MDVASDVGSIERIEIGPTFDRARLTQEVGQELIL